MKIKSMLAPIGKFFSSFLTDQRTYERPPVKPLSDILLEPQNVELNPDSTIEMKLVGLKSGETLRQKRDSLKNSAKKIATLDEARVWFKVNWEAKRMNILIAAPGHIERRGFRGVILQVPAIGWGKHGFQEGFINFDSPVANNDEVFILVLE